MANYHEMPFPTMDDYPKTEEGWNCYANAWVSHRRRVAMLGNIPMEAIEEFRAAMEWGRQNGWREEA